MEFVLYPTYAARAKTKRARGEGVERVGGSVREIGQIKTVTKCIRQTAA